MYRQTLPERSAVITITAQSGQKIKFNSELQDISQVSKFENLTMFCLASRRSSGPEICIGGLK
jgi:hypothetical protein